MDEAFYNELLNDARHSQRELLDFVSDRATPITEWSPTWLAEYARLIRIAAADAGAVLGYLQLF